MANKVIQRLIDLRPLILTCTIAGTVLAILSPYGTSQFTLPWRFVFWIGLCFAGGIGAGLSDYLLNKTGRNVSMWGRAFLQSLSGTILVTLLLLGLNYALSYSVTPWDVVRLLFFVWIISISISVIGALTDRRSATHDAKPDQPALFDRLPLHLQNSEIYALAAEDHYVRIITSKGEEMVLMRLSDAMKEVAPLEGLSPHRSWWVAKAGVEKLAKSNGKTEIVLKTGHKVPVSRSAAKTVREAGWR